jgi:nicotinamide phosphoribosyltransferase
MKNNPLLMTDGYKTSHHNMYPKETSLVYSNFTPRSVKYMDERAKEIVVFGLQYTIRYIHELYEENFFKRNKEEVIGEAKKYFSSYLGVDYDVSHFEKLHDLGYLPIKVKGIVEGTIIGEKIPILTIYNTNPDFFWLPNFLETLLSSLLWKPLHSASISYGLKKLLNKYAKETDGGNMSVVNFQGHDFSFRGMQHPESAISSGLGFLVNFWGTDTLPTLMSAKHYYGSENVGFSVPGRERVN